MPTSLGRVQPIFKGAYDSATTYKKLDNVFYNGDTWVCQIDNTVNVTPSAESNAWQMVASKGGSGGFGAPSGSAEMLPQGSNPTINITASGPDTEKIFNFQFGIPAGGATGPAGADGSKFWFTSVAPTEVSTNVYSFTINNLSGATGDVEVGDIIFYETFYYPVTSVNSTYATTGALIDLGTKIWNNTQIGLLEEVFQHLKYDSAAAGAIASQLVTSLQGNAVWDHDQIMLLNQVFSHIDYLDQEGGYYADLLVDALYGNAVYPISPVASVDGKIGEVTVLPTGGVTGQVLAKTSSSDYAVSWVDAGSEEVTNSTAGAVSVALDAGKIYNFTGELTSLTITLNSTTGMAHYHFSFNCGSSVPVITFPNTVILPSNATFIANTHYEVDIYNNYGAVMAWEIS